MTAQPEPSATTMSGSPCVQLQCNMESSAKSTQKRAPPKATQRQDGNEFERNLVQNQISYLRIEADQGNDTPGMAFKVATILVSIDEDNDKPDTVSKSPASATAKGTSPAELPRVIMAQVESSGTTMSGSPGVQLQSSTMDSSATSKKVKSAEDALRCSNHKRAQLRVIKSFGDDPPGGPQKRAPPKETQCRDENEFRTNLVQNQITYLTSEVNERTDKPGIAFKIPRIIEIGPQSPISPLPRTVRQGRRKSRSHYRAPDHGKVDGRNLVQNRIPYLASKVDEGPDQRSIAFQLPKRIETGPSSLLLRSNSRGPSYQDEAHSKESISISCLITNPPRTHLEIP
jgi:hypothetical protein